MSTVLVKPVLTGHSPARHTIYKFSSNNTQSPVFLRKLVPLSIFKGIFIGILRFYLGIKKHPYRSYTKCHDHVNPILNGWF
jgi:hypothetical protein